MAGEEIEVVARVEVVREGEVEGVVGRPPCKSVNRRVWECQRGTSRHDFEWNE